MRFFRWSLAASFASLALFFAPRSFAAEPSQADDVPPPLAPMYPKEPHPGIGAGRAVEKAPLWYGHQVLIPTLIFDAMTFVGLGLSSTSGSNYDSVLMITGILGRSLSGPFVHATHGQALRALGSFGLETSWLPAVIAAVPLSFCMPEESCGTSEYLLAGVPFVVGIAGTVVDTLVLAKVPSGYAQDKPKTGFSLAPYAFPSYSLDPRTEARRPAFQLGLAGQF